MSKGTPLAQVESTRAIATRSRAAVGLETADSEWLAFPGGELEGARPRALCQACRSALQAAAAGPASGPAAGRSAHGAVRGAICFHCYRADLDRRRAMQAAANLETASEARFQVSLPFEPVNHARLAMLKVERVEARAAALHGAGSLVDRRHRAQIAARHALQAVVARVTGRAQVNKAFSAAMHAAELQLPDTWLPFVVAR